MFKKLTAPLVTTGLLAGSKLYLRSLFVVAAVASLSAEAITIAA